MYSHFAEHIVQSVRFVRFVDRRGLLEHAYVGGSAGDDGNRTNGDKRHGEHHHGFPRGNVSGKHHSASDAIVSIVFGIIKKMFRFRPRRRSPANTYLRLGTVTGTDREGAYGVVFLAPPLPPPRITTAANSAAGDVKLVLTCRDSMPNII